MIDVELAHVAEVVRVVTSSTPGETKLERFHILWLRHIKGRPTQFINSFSPENMDFFEDAV
jgi:hypothetical protein